MSSRTRSAASSFSLVCLPMICVLTGPAAGKVSMIVSAWNFTSVSVSRGWNTLHAPGQGSVLSSSFRPSSSSPSTYVSNQSLRELASDSYSPIKSPAISDITFSSKNSARLALKSSSPSVSGSAPNIIVIPSSGISGSMPSTSVSIPGSSPSASSPCGAAYKPLSISAIIRPR